MGSSSTSEPSDLDALLARIRACRLCVEAPLGAPLPHAPRPVLHVSARARILVAGQAPGTKVHLTGQSFNDASGDRLRAWMGVSRAEFYDTARIAIASMGFCFPGQDAKGADLPPRRECAATWHDLLFAELPAFELILAVGRAAQAYHLSRLGLGRFLKKGLTETVADWRAIHAAPAHAAGVPVRTVVYALPHPSWRNTGWLKRNPFFEEELLPVLKADVARILRAGVGEGRGAAR